MLRQGRSFKFLSFCTLNWALLDLNKLSKVVVIAGCSSGCGEGARKAVVNKGYRVWGTLRDAQGRSAVPDSGVGGGFKQRFGDRHGRDR